MSDMKLENLQNKLMAAARANPPSDAVPYAFEKRIMARLINGQRVDLLGDWSAALWRAAVTCLAITLLTGAWSVYSSHRSGAGDFSQEFEAAVFASAGSVDEVGQAW